MKHYRKHCSWFSWFFTDYGDDWVVVVEAKITSVPAVVVYDDVKEVGRCLKACQDTTDFLCLAVHFSRLDECYLFDHNWYSENPTYEDDRYNILAWNVFFRALGECLLLLMSISNVLSQANILY